MFVFLTFACISGFVSFIIDLSRCRLSSLDSPAIHTHNNPHICTCKYMTVLRASEDSCVCVCDY